MNRSEMQRFLTDRARRQDLDALVARQSGPHAMVAVLRAQGYGVTLDDLLKAGSEGALPPHLCLPGRPLVGAGDLR